MRFILAFIVLFFSCNLVAQDFKSERTTVNLLIDLNQTTSNSPINFALDFKIAPDWYIYWKNPGDSGLPPKIKTNRTKELSALDPIFPVPEVLRTKEILNFVYHKSAQIRFPFQVNHNFDFANNLEIQVSWLVCKIDCIPESFVKTISLTEGLPEKTKSYNLIHSISPLKKQLSIEYFREGDNLILNIPNKTGALYFAPDNDKYHIATAQQIYTDNRIEFPNFYQKHPELTQPPKGLLLATTQKQPSYAINFKPKTKSGHSYLKIIIFALLGGLLLNLMPCVFPVISIKLLEFSQTAKETGSSTAQQGLYFSAGVITFFMLLFLIMEAFKLAGNQIGWGFQLQSPEFVFLMIILFFLIGLYFLGTIKEQGHWLQNFSGRLNLPQKNLKSFLSGSLATLVATPCTAPFMAVSMGASLNYTFTGSLLIFLMLGLGMSSPYLLLSSSKNLRNLIPKPGPWMEKLKIALSIPIFLTCAWLLFVLSKLAGSISVIFCLGFMLILSLALFILKDQSGKKLLLFYPLLLIILVTLITKLNSARIEKGIDTNPYGMNYLTYSPEELDRALNQYRAIYVDFTASWCLTCQFNKKASFSSGALQAFLKQQDIALMQADWTARDPEIATEIKRLGRLGVPLNVFYSKDKEPVVLPNILNDQIVIKYFQKNFPD